MKVWLTIDENGDRKIWYSRPVWWTGGWKISCGTFVGRSDWPDLPWPKEHGEKGISECELSPTASRDWADEISLKLLAGYSYSVQELATLMRNAAKAHYEEGKP